MSVAEDLSAHGIVVPTGKYQGYAKNRRPDPDPELTSTGPGSPCGEYLRRYWQPVCMTSEIPDDRPLRLRIMGVIPPPFLFSPFPLSLSLSLSVSLSLLLPPSLSSLPFPPTSSSLFPPSLSFFFPPSV